MDNIVAYSTNFSTVYRKVFLQVFISLISQKTITDVQFHVFSCLVLTDSSPKHKDVEFIFVYNKEKHHNGKY